MKATDIKTGVAYGVLSPTTYKSKNKRDPQTAQRSDLFKGTLHDNRKYVYSKNAYENKYSFPDHAPVLPADSKDTWGVLFVSDQGICVVVRPVDVVGLWDVLDARWTAEETNRKLEAERKEQEERIRREKIEIEKTRSESIKSQITSQVQKLHAGANISYSTDAYPTPVTKVTMSIDDFSHIIERMFELIEMGETV